MDRTLVTCVSIAACCGLVMQWAAAEVQVQSAAAESGIVATHDTTGSTIPSGQQWMTGGLSVGDFNRDGLDDLFIIGGGAQPDRLYINQGAGIFIDRAGDWQVNALHGGNGVAVGDYDNDGWLDIYVTSFGGIGTPGPGQNRLYRNNGNSTFTDVAAAAGVNFTAPVTANGYGAAWGDMDLDGDLDLMVTAWHQPSDGNRLFRNNGDGTFEDATAALPGIASVWGFQPAFADMNGDLYPELLIAADFETSRYYLNVGPDLPFVDFTPINGTGLDDNGMGQTIVDINNDGLLDWYVTSVHNDSPPPGNNPGNMLYLATINDIFVEISMAAAVNDGGWGWGTIAVDVDQDGLTDIVEVNGRPAKGSQWIDERAKMFRNTNGLVFEEIAGSCGLDSMAEGRGVAILDADGDLDMDLVILNNAGDIELYRNTSTDPGHALIVSLDTSTNPLLAPDGFGATIIVEAGGHTMTRVLNGSPSYLSTSSLSAHFGVGESTTIDTVTVRWPRGQETTMASVAANQHLVVTAPGPGDLDADGTVGILDLLDLIGRWGDVSDAFDLKADLDGDRTVGVLDLLTLLGVWSE